jgi:hypothetical protein
MRLIYTAFLTLVIILLTGCRDIQIKTIVNNDGSITRTYIITKDIQFKKDKYADINEEQISTEIQGIIDNSYFPLDTLWEISFNADTVNKETTSRFSKTYKNIKKLQEDFNKKNYRLKPLNPQVEIKRKFSWFSTENTFKESYKSIFTGKPYKEYFTEEEIKLIRKGKTKENDSIQLKYYAWVAYAIVDEIITIINSESDSTFNLNAWKKFMYDKIAENTFSTPKEDINPFMLPEINSNRNDIDFSDAERLITSIRRYSDVDLTKEKENKVQEILDQKMELYMSLFTDHLLFSIKLPGKISNTNADSLKGKTAFWRMDPFIAGANVEMVLTTKQSNAGIPITIGVIIIAFLSYYFIRKKRR